MHGKIPAEAARRAKRYGKPVIALAGTIGAAARVTYDADIDAYASILPAPNTPSSTASSTSLTPPNAPCASSWSVPHSPPPDGD